MAISSLETIRTSQIEDNDWTTPTPDCFDKSVG
jgi:hypothetical protein